ncbi:plasmid partitioning protein RepB [Aureimonas psammosilenae]|uniref:plasmid partitioning protein RepB n=1 Tax=Aureimonas psammosilenae TaxID=2495496 RepID=UPI0012611426|nr:plasmid partitioning protein RepB [Aureimonas psammosilenae]
MSKRKDELRALLSSTGPKAEDERAPEIKSIEGLQPAPEPRPERATSGAVKAMGLALGNLRGGAEEARALRESLAKGAHVVEIDPALIEPAFLSDRLSRAGDGDESFEALKASIAEGGQEVPVLLRPHPDAAKAASGRYQTAYGHRRIAALAALGRKVRAVVRPLSDEELVIAQGKENSERRDLSFIERAMFAKALIARGFERRTVQASLALHKAELTRLLQVAEAIPSHFAAAIGPAPKAGRLRWMALAELIATEAGHEKAQDEITRPSFGQAASDERFAMLLARLTRTSQKTRGGSETLTGEGGARIAALRRSTKAVTIEIAAKDFADYVAAELPALYAAFLARNKDG